MLAAAAVVAVAGLSAEAPPRVMLTKNIKTPDPIPRAGIEAATRAMESGRLYRYNVDAAEDSGRKLLGPSAMIGGVFTDMCGGPLDPIPACPDVALNEGFQCASDDACGAEQTCAELDCDSQ